MTPIFAAWAILATVVAVVVYILMRREVKRLDRMGYEQYQRAKKLAGELDRARDDAGRYGRELLRVQAALTSYKATEKARLSAHMREIGLLGNTSPKRKRVA